MWFLKLFYSILTLILFLLTLIKNNINNVIILFKYTKSNIVLVYVDSYKKSSHFILTGFIVDYRKRVFIISIIAKIQCLICYVLLKFFLVNQL